MSYKIPKPIVALLALAALVAAVLVSAVSGTSGGVALPETRAGDVVTSTNLNQGLTVTPLGDIELAASGDTTKTLVNYSATPDCGVANLKTWWNGWNGSGNYTEWKNTSWNAPGTCGDAFGSFTLRFYNNDGTYSGTFTQTDGETIQNDIDTVGSGTSKVSLQRPCDVGVGTHWIVTAPWGTDQVYDAC